VSFAVVNLFTESGNVGAPHLVESPQVDVINYTGSTKVGREIARKAARTLKRVCLELGEGGCKQVVSEGPAGRGRWKSSKNSRLGSR
jgi:delta 1-pyrroline-5-carboxylate dehydrogenase